MQKDSEHFAETNGWGFFNFGHHAPPYAEKAAAAPNDVCAFCHTASATHDMVFTTFYPILEKPRHGRGTAEAEPTITTGPHLFKPRRLPMDPRFVTKTMTALSIG